MNHSDPFDQASDLEQRERDAGLAKVRAAKYLIATGACYNCAEPLTAGELFCARMAGEKDCCRSDYELRQRK